MIRLKSVSPIVDQNFDLIVVPIIDLCVDPVDPVDPVVDSTLDQIIDHIIDRIVKY